jgi:hypothetical protein
MRINVRAFKAVLFLMFLFLVITPSLCSSGQFKITEVYDGNTVRAERYDRQCLP